MQKHYEFAFSLVEFEILLDYLGIYVHQEVVNVRIRLEEIIGLRDVGLVDKTMDIDKLIYVQGREKIMTNDRVLEILQKQEKEENQHMRQRRSIQ